MLDAVAGVDTRYGPIGQQRGERLVDCVEQRGIRLAQSDRNLPGQLWFTLEGMYEAQAGIGVTEDVVADGVGRYRPAVEVSLHQICNQVRLEYVRRSAHATLAQHHASEGVDQDPDFAACLDLPIVTNRAGAR